MARASLVILISIVASASLCTAARPRFSSLSSTKSASTERDLNAAASSDLSFISLVGSDDVIGAVMHPRHKHAVAESSNVLTGQAYSAKSGYSDDTFTVNLPGSDDDIVAYKTEPNTDNDFASTDGGLEIAASITLPGSDNEIVTRVRRHSNDEDAAGTTGAAAAAAADAAVAAAIARYEQELSNLVTLPGSDDETVSFASEAPDAADTDTATAEESTVKEAIVEEPTVEDAGDIAASVTLPGSDNEIVSFVPTHKTTGAAVHPEAVVAASLTLPGSDNETVSFVPMHKTTAAAAHPEAVAASVTLPGSDNEIVSFVPHTKTEAASPVEASVIPPGSVTIIPYSAFTSRPDQPSVAAQ